VSVATTVEQPDDKRSDRRADRLAARYTLWDESRLRRLKNCGRVAVAGGGVTIRASGSGGDRRAGFAGLSTCGSVWSCPVCSAKVLAHRADELGRALGAWSQSGGRVVMVTLTMRHRAWQRLSSLWDAVGYAWGSVTSGAAWEDLQAAHGVLQERTVTRGSRKGQIVIEPRLGWVRVVEVTNGANGWHVHVHAALLVDDTVTAEQADQIGCAMFQRWRDALVRKGFEAPLARSGGLDVKVWNGETGVLGDYFAKNTYTGSSEKAGCSDAALEIAGGAFKKGRGENRTPFQVLADVVGLGDAEDLALWHEWEAASRGRRQMTWSVGLRDRLLPDEADLTDEQIAEQDAGGDDLVRLTSPGLRRLVGLRVHRQVLDAAEHDDGGAQLRRVLDAYGIGWKPPLTT